MKRLLPLVLIAVLASCTQHPQTKQDTQKPIPQSVIYITPSGNKIIFLDNYYTAYAAAIQTNFANRDNIYQQIIKDSIYDKYFLKSEYLELINSRLSSPIQKVDGVANFASEIVDNRIKIEQIITAALVECNKQTQNDSVTVYILPCTGDMQIILERMGGVAGVTAGSKQIMLTIDPEVGGWANMLSYNVAHEFNHAYWTKMNLNKSQLTLLNYLVFEGRADSYAHLIYPNIVCPWTKALSEGGEAELWNRIKPQLNNTDMAFQYGVMFGLKNQYPIWGGYTLGYHIVQSALKKHPELTPVKWTNLAPQKILEMSDYK